MMVQQWLSKKVFEAFRGDVGGVVSLF